MNPHNYNPRAGSLASQVIAFFQRNPDEELDLDAIVDKFDTGRANIHTQLGGALDAVMLVRERNVDGEYVYKPGKNLPKPDGVNMDHARSVRHPSAPPIPVPPKAHRAPRQADTTPLPALADVVIEDAVPLPSINLKPDKQDWRPLLRKLTPGQSFELPLRARFMLQTHVTDLHKQQLGPFTIRAFPDKKTLRVWCLQPKPTE